MKTYFTSLGRWELLDTFSLRVAEAVVKLHLVNIKENKNILKIDHKRQVSRVVSKDKSYVIKEFRKPGPWWIFRPDYISWKNSIRLKELDIAVPSVYAWLRSKDGRGFIIMEDLGDQVLKSVLQNIGPELPERVELIKKLSKLVASVHSKNLVYGDMKLANVLLKDGSLFLVDMDKVKLKKRLNLRDRAYNLVQILNSFPKDLTKRELDIFLETYVLSLHKQ